MQHLLYLWRCILLSPFRIYNSSAHCSNMQRPREEHHRQLATPVYEWTRTLFWPLAFAALWLKMDHRWSVFVCLPAGLPVCLSVYLGQGLCSLGCPVTLSIRDDHELSYLLGDWITGLCHNVWCMCSDLQVYWKNKCLARVFARISNRFKKTLYCGFFFLWKTTTTTCLYMSNELSQIRGSRKNKCWLARTTSLLQHLAVCSVNFQRLHCYWRICILVISQADLLLYVGRFKFI